MSEQSATTRVAIEPPTYKTYVPPTNREVRESNESAAGFFGLVLGACLVGLVSAMVNQNHVMGILCALLAVAAGAFGWGAFLEQRGRLIQERAKEAEQASMKWFNREVRPAIHRETGYLLVEQPFAVRSYEAIDPQGKTVLVWLDGLEEKNSGRVELPSSLVKTLVYPGANGYTLDPRGVALTFSGEH